MASTIRHQSKAADLLGVKIKSQKLQFLFVLTPLKSSVIPNTVLASICYPVFKL